MSAVLKPAEPRVGIFLNEPADVYYQRRLEVARNSTLGIIDTQSPAHLLHWSTDTEDEEQSAALIFGKAYHTATLEPDKFDSLYSVLPADAPRDMRRFRNAAKPSIDTLKSIDFWDAFESANRGKTFLTRHAYDQAIAMARSQRKLTLDFGDVRITLAELIDECETEVTAYWIDEDTGIYCALRADLWSEDLALAGDLKSCMDASREAFSRAINSHRYHVQHAHYCEGFRAVGKPLRSFILMPVEKRAPHVPAAYHVDAPSEERGWAIRQRSMQKLHACLQSGKWPPYTSTVEPLGIPAYGHYDSRD